MHRFIIPLFALAFLLVSCGKAPTTTVPPPTEQQSSTSVGEPMMQSSSSEPVAMEQSSKGPFGFDGKIATGMHQIVLHTTKGDIAITLNADAAPKTVTNFLTLAKAGFYNGLTFHRVLPDFMIQAGDPNGDGTGGESIFGSTFEDEINAFSYGLHAKKLKDVASGQALPSELADKTIQEYYESQGYVYNASLISLPMVRGALAMANRGANTNGSQFFIIQTDATPWLEGKHTVFGQVTSGLDVVDAIANVPRDSGDKPLEPITYTVEIVN